MAFISLHLDVSQVLAYAAHVEAGAAEVAVGSRAAVASTAHTIESAMKDAAPVLTGTLRGSISASISGESAEIGPNTRYAGYVENGTSMMAPEPYAAPAFDQHAPELEPKLAAVGVAALL